MSAVWMKRNEFILEYAIPIITGDQCKPLDETPIRSTEGRRGIIVEPHARRGMSIIVECNNPARQSAVPPFPEAVRITGCIAACHGRLGSLQNVARLAPMQSALCDGQTLVIHGTGVQSRLTCVGAASDVSCPARTHEMVGPEDCRLRGVKRRSSTITTAARIRKAPKAAYPCSRSPITR